MANFLEFFSDSRIQKWRRIVLLFLLAAISVFGWLRMAETLKVYSYLIQLGLNPHPLYFMITGGLIGTLFLIALFIRLFNLYRSTQFIHLIMILLGILFLVESLILSINPPGILSWVMEFLFILIVYFLPEKSIQRKQTK
jgi:hypothetical protein